MAKLPEQAHKQQAYIAITYPGLPTKSVQEVFAMGRKNKALKTKTPEQVAEELLKRKKALFEAVGLQAEAAPLPSSDALSITRGGDSRPDGDGKKVAEDSITREDAFKALRTGLTVEAYLAARRLEVDLLTRRNESDHGRLMARIDGGEIRCRQDAIQAAGERVDEVFAKIGQRDSWLLSSLIAPTAALALQHPTWRGIVGYITGEENAHSQGAVVRHATANLAAAYEQIDRKSRRAA